MKALRVTKLRKLSRTDRYDRQNRSTCFRGSKNDMLSDHRWGRDHRWGHLREPFNFLNTGRLVLGLANDEGDY